ncbi:hypothetical protein A2U01_0052720, partial [Trifolium medium]|nr:hypothetical protein [Trifolium medium]
ERSCLGVGCSHFGMVEQTELLGGNRCWKKRRKRCASSVLMGGKTIGVGLSDKGQLERCESKDDEFDLE